MFCGCLQRSSLCGTAVGSVVMSCSVNTYACKNCYQQLFIMIHVCLIDSFFTPIDFNFFAFFENFYISLSVLMYALRS